MSLINDFQILDIEPLDNSIIKRDYLKFYYQQGAKLNDSDQNVEFVFGEKKTIIIKLVKLILNSI